MTKLKIDPWLVGLMLLILAACVIGPIVDDSPAKPEVEMSVAETNANATIITWTKTSNGHTITWGFATANGRTFVLLPVTR